MEKNVYIKPALTVVEFRVESGYASSMAELIPGNPLDGYLEMMMTTQGGSNDYGATETFSNHGTWQEDNGGFWF